MGKRDLLLSFGTNENPFNGWCRKKIAAFPFAYGDKIIGMGYGTKGKFDLIGYWRGSYLGLENKFVANFSNNAKDSTILVGPGCSVKTKRWSHAQLENMQHLWDAWQGSGIENTNFYVGGLIGVLGTEDLPDIIIAVTAQWVLETQVGYNAKSLRMAREVALKTGRKFFACSRDMSRPRMLHPLERFEEMIESLDAVT